MAGSSENNLSFQQVEVEVEAEAELCNNRWTSCESCANIKSQISHEQVRNISSTIMNMWIDCEQAMNKSWTSLEQVIKSHELNMA